MRHHLKNRRIWLIAGIAVGVIVITLALVWFFMIRGDKAPTSTKNDKNQSQPTQQPTAQQPADPTPVSFKSTKLNIEITHRKDWTLKEAADGAITLTSPNVSYSKADD